MVLLQRKEGNILTEEQQWKKLEFIRSIVEEVWGKLISNWNVKEIIVKMVISFFIKVRLKITALLQNKKGSP